MRGSTVALVALLALFVSCGAHAVDVFHTNREVASAPGAAMLGDRACREDAPESPLTLAAAVNRALCNNPETHSAWATVEARAAALGQSKAAYLPTLSATGQYVHDNSITNVRDHPELSTNFATAVQEESLSLGWLLYDFGGRHAKLKSAEALLAAAQASEDGVLQQVFANTAKLYYDAQAATAQVIADQAITDDAQHSLAAAKARVQRGVAPITEQYQAETYLDQDLLTQQHDQGQALSMTGALASAMTLRPETPLMLAPMDQEPTPSGAFQQAVTQLMDEAMRIHPAILAAQKQLDAAQAGVTAAKAEGRPSLRVVGEYSRNNQPVQLGLGLPHFPSTGRDGYVGIQINIPIFSGFATTYQVREAQAQVDVQTAALDKARQQVALQVWQSYQALKAGTQALQTSADLERTATVAWESAQRRYRTGAGNILELLNTQTVLAQARQRRVTALTDWHYERLALAASLGQLGSSSVGN